MRDDMIKVVVDGIEFDLEMRNGLMTCNGEPLNASLVQVGTSSYSLLVNGKSHELTIVSNGQGTQVTQSGVRSEVRILDQKSMFLASLGGSDGARKHALEIRAPMPGLVLAVEVKEGATVASGQGIVVLEAMKMENEIFSSGAGVVEKVHVENGDAVTKGQLLVTLGEA